MELFYSQDFNGGTSGLEGAICSLDREESGHCVKVLRHRSGDEINVIDGEGTMYTCRLTDASPTAAQAVVIKAERGWGGHPYHLDMAVCPTKNNDRFEWFAEKATETGLDEISPVIGDHSERKVYKEERLRKILVSAAKQSLKGAVPQVREPLSVRDYILSSNEDSSGDNMTGTLKLIAYCFEGEMKRVSIKDVLDDFKGDSIKILIGPEGDFSQEEAELAISNGFIPVHLGSSRLRTETAALTAVVAVYMHFMD